MIIESASPGETLDIGRRLAPLLRPNDVLLVDGRLGAGKTLFISGVAEGLGVGEQVTSPSFVIVHEYEGFMRIIHADMYRLASIAEFDDLELPSLARDGLLVVEWGGVVASALPDHLRVSIGVSGETTRTIELTPVGSWTSRPLQELSE